MTLKEIAKTTNHPNGWISLYRVLALVSLCRAQVTYDDRAVFSVQAVVPPLHVRRQWHLTHHKPVAQPVHHRFIYTRTLNKNTCITCERFDIIQRYYLLTKAETEFKVCHENIVLTAVHSLTWVNLSVVWTANAAFQTESISKC